MEEDQQPTKRAKLSSLPLPPFRILLEDVSPPGTYENQTYFPGMKYMMYKLTVVHRETGENVPIPDDETNYFFRPGMVNKDYNIPVSFDLYIQGGNPDGTDKLLKKKQFFGVIAEPKFLRREDGAIAVFVFRVDALSKHYHNKPFYVRFRFRRSDLPELSRDTDKFRPPEDVQGPIFYTK